MNKHMRTSVAMLALLASAMFPAQANDDMSPSTTLASSILLRSNPTVTASATMKEQDFGYGTKKLDAGLVNGTITLAEADAKLMLKAGGAEMLMIANDGESMTAGELMTKSAVSGPLLL